MLVSVIMPTYNCARFIEESVKSVVNQTVSDWELLIVDDCSTDDTYQMLLPWIEKYPNIRYHCLEENGGPAVARSAAMRMATGKYLAFLDSDDLWAEDKLEKQIKFMEETNSLFSCTSYRLMKEDGTLENMMRVPPEKTNYNAMLRLANPIGNSTVMYNREALGEFQVPPIKKRNDFALWLLILKHTKYCYGMADVLAYYRLREVSVSSNKSKLVKFQWQLYREVEKLSLLKSLWAMGCWVIAKFLRLDYKRVD